MTLFRWPRLSLPLLGAVAIVGHAQQTPTRAPSQPKLATMGAIAPLTESGLRFRDLNRSGTLDKYEDWRLTRRARASDLVSSA